MHDMKDRHIKFTLRAGTYSIDNINTKVKVAITMVLLQKQDWEALQIKDFKLVIPEHFLFMRSNSFLLYLVYSATILKRLHVTNQLYPLVHAKHHLTHHLTQNHHHYTVNKSVELKTRKIGNPQTC